MKIFHRLEIICKQMMIHSIPTAMDSSLVLAESKNLMGEVVLDDLLIKMMKTLLKISQATKGCILLPDGQGLNISAVGYRYPRESIQLRSLPAEKCNDLPFSVIKKVSQKKSSVLINSSGKRREFLNEIYIQKHPTVSIFCLPLLGKQNELTGIFYLENQKRPCHFSHKQIKLLQLLTVPATLCLENARIHKQLRDYSSSLEMTIDELRKKQQVSQGHTTVLSNTLNALTQESELDSFAKKVLAAITHQLNASSSVLWLYDARTTSISHYITYLGNLTLTRSTAVTAMPPITCFPNSKKHPLWKQLIGKTFPVHLSAEKQQILEPEWQQWLAAQHARSLLVIPVCIEGDCLGFLNIWSHSHKPFLPAQVELAEVLVDQVSLAIRLSKLLEQNRSAAVLMERNRLAQEIHDTLAQTLTGISLQADVAQRVVKQQPAEASQLIGEVAELARQGLIEAKQSIWGLQNEIHNSCDLSQALCLHLKQITAGKAIQTEVQVQGEGREFSPEVSFNLLRIGQEAITNSFKHANAEKIWVTLIFSDSQSQLRVRDNGQGFEPRRLGKHDGFGLISMGQRAET